MIHHLLLFLALAVAIGVYPGAARAQQNTQPHLHLPSKALQAQRTGKPARPLYEKRPSNYSSRWQAKLIPYSLAKTERVWDPTLQGRSGVTTRNAREVYSFPLRKISKPDCTWLAKNAAYFAWCDFDRAVSLAAQFERPEIRLMAQLKLAQGILAGPPKRTLMTEELITLH